MRHFIIFFLYLWQYNASSYCIALELSLLFGSLFHGTVFQLGSCNYCLSFATSNLGLLKAPCHCISLPLISLLIPDHTYVNIFYVKLSLLLKSAVSLFLVCILFYANILVNIKVNILTNIISYMLYMYS